MHDPVVNKADFPRLVMKIVALSRVSIGIFKAPINQRNGVFDFQSPLAAAYHERRIVHRETLGKILIMRQDATTITN